jgi:hypothetical protein
MNRGDIKNRVLALLGETTAGETFITDTELNYFVDDGGYDMCVRGKIYEKTEQITLATDTQSYPVADDWVDTIAVYKASDDPDAPNAALERITPQQASRVYIVSGRPDYFFLVGTKIYFVDVPSSTYNGKNYVHHYYALPAAYVDDTSEPSFPAKWHPVLVDFVYMRALIKYKMFTSAQQIWVSYNQRLGISPVPPFPYGQGQAQ